MSRTLVSILPILALVACSSASDDTARRLEGDDPFECEDGADNDRDGLFDCDDPDCADSPSCEESDTDADADADTDTDTDGDVDTGVEPLPDTAIDWVDYSYTRSEWRYEVGIEGQADEVALSIYQYEGGYAWEEEHDLDRTDAGPYGYWEEWGVDLAVVDDWKDQVNGVSTLFQGTGSMEATMTWMVQVWDDHGDYAECAVWGKRPEYYASQDCRAVDPGGR